MSSEKIDFANIGDLDIRDAVASGLDKVHPKQPDDDEERIADRKEKEDQHTRRATAEIDFIEQQAKMAAALACIAPESVLEHYGGEEGAPEIIGEEATEILRRLSEEGNR